MISRSSKIFFAFTLLLSPASFSFAAVSQKAMVATAEPLATQAAVETLKLGGTAADAAIAAQWVLNVVEPLSSGLGGGGFFVYYEAATRKVYTFDGRETAPAAAFPEMFLDKQGKPYEFWPDRNTGGLPVGVPGTLRLLETVHQRFGSGKIPFGKLFEPAIAVAENGFPVSERLSAYIDGEAPRLHLFPGPRRIFLDAQGQALKPGTILKQPELAKTFQLIAEKGPSVFYEGEMAEEIVRAVRGASFHPGLMTLEDLKAYRVKEREPVKGEYRDYEIWSMGPPSSGGPAVLETLHILNSFPLKDLSAFERVSVFAQAQGLAFKDRNLYLGDPDAVTVPLDKLLSADHAKELAAGIALDGKKVTANFGAVHVPEGTHTTHISIVDEKGNMAAFTTTIEHMFGSALMVPGRGFFLNNELTDFDAQPRDAEGRLAANAAGPGKRPRSSMSPTLVFKKDGRPVMIVGSPGGSKIIGAVLNVIVNVLDYGMTLDEALKSPRVINRDGPVELEAPLSGNAALKKKLAAQGLKTELAKPLGNVQAIVFQEGQLIGGSDPRGNGAAEGYGEF